MMITFYNKYDNSYHIGQNRKNYNIMRNEVYNPEALKILLKKEEIATLPQLKIALGTNVDMTVFRKLRELSYRTSYSNRGQYYTLDEIAKFDESGLWFCQSVCFSQYGSLMQTVKFFITHSEAGYTAHDLDVILQVKTKEPLLCLMRKGVIYRQKLPNKAYIYFSADSKIRRKQLLFRQDLQSEVDTSSDRTATILFVSLLDEKQRRLYAGLESLKLGYGGNKKVASYLGVDVHTVAQGKRELIERTYKEQGTRQAGAGRNSIKKKPTNYSKT